MQRRNTHIPLQRGQSPLLVLRSVDLTEHLVRIDDRDAQVLCGDSAPGLMGAYGEANQMCLTCVDAALAEGWTAIRHSERSWVSLRRLQSRLGGPDDGS